jgi:hypothetical protein
MWANASRSVIRIAIAAPARSLRSALALGLPIGACGEQQFLDLYSSPYGNGASRVTSQIGPLTSAPRWIAAAIPLGPRVNQGLGGP